MRTENEMFHTIINAAKSDDVCVADFMSCHQTALVSCL